MRQIIKPLTGILIVLNCLSISYAQTKKNAKAAEINNLISSRNYVFNANMVNVFRGGTRALNSSYDVTITRDSVIAYLPYFGRAYMADYGSIDGGINFTSTNFVYTATAKKNGWNIRIDFKDAKISDPKGVRQIQLTVSDDGYGNLQVLSSNRDPISFNGTIEPRPTAKHK